MGFDRAIATAKNDLISFREAEKTMPDYWSSYNETLDLMLPLVDRWHKSNHKSLPSFQEILKELNYPDERLTDVFKILNYLSGDGVKMLEHYFEYRENDKVFPVSGAHALSVMENGEFLHPETSEPVSDPKTKIHMGFRFRSSVMTEKTIN